jgi:amino acid transporter
MFVYVMISAVSPFYVWRHDRDSFRFLSHVVPAIIGIGVVGYGVYEFILPSQPPPANTFWAYILGIFLLAIVAAFAALRYRRLAIARLGQVASDGLSGSPVTEAAAAAAVR